MNGPYKPAKLVPVAELAKVTADYKAHNDARAAKLDASARQVIRTNAGLDEMAEAARLELIEQCRIGAELEHEGAHIETRAAHDSALRRACAEFFGALGTASPTKRGHGIDRMWEAIESLKRYQGIDR